MVNKDFDNTKLENKSFTHINHDKYVFNNLFIDFISYFLICVVLLGSFKIYISMDELLYDIKQNNLNYVFPKYWDLMPSIYFLIFMIVFHEIFRYFLADKMEKYLTKRYENEEKIMIEIYKNKVTTNIYKFFFYLLSTILGFMVLKDLKFFPWSMFGKGDLSNLFTEGYPNLFYFEKPDNFDLYYNFNLAFALFDGYVLITNPLQSDFLFMIIHHFATYSLIVFSFISNLSGVGSMVYFSHYTGDVFSYIVRTVLHLDVPEIYSAISTFCFLAVFYYTRLFVFGDILYNVYNGLNYSWTIIESNLVGFLLIIMLLNILWIVLITKKFIKYCMTGNIEEIYKFKINKNKIK